jgi:hypothetical protein
MRTIRTQAQCPAERRMAGEHAGLPARKAFHEPRAQQCIQRLQRRDLIETHAIGRVRQYQTVRVRRDRQLHEFAPLEYEVIPDAAPS